MRKTDQEVQRLMREYAKHGEVGRAARAASMDRKTARKYIDGQKLPSELRADRDWRTRPDPFDADWPMIEQMLEDLQLHFRGAPRPALCPVCTFDG